MAISFLPAPRAMTDYSPRRAWSASTALPVTIPIHALSSTIDGRVLRLVVANRHAIAEAVQSAVRVTFEEELRNETTADPAA